MSKIRTMFFVLLGTFGLIAGLTTTPAFSAEQGTQTTKTTKAPKVDVNHATSEELQELPGIGEVYAQKIIDGRPYHTEEDLVQAGIPQSTVTKIKSAIKFGRVKTAKTPAKIQAKTESKSASKTTSKTDTSNEPAQVPPHKGMVWVNKNSMVYHKEGDRWYGNTKNGEFMNEKDAIKFGARLSKQD